MMVGESNDRKQNHGTDRWWTQKRTRIAALASIIGGIGGLLGNLSGLGLVGLSVGDTGVGITPGAVILLYPVWHVLLAVGVVAANSWYGTSFERRGRIAGILLVVTLLGEAGTILILMMSHSMLGEFLIPLGVLHATMYLAIRLVGSLYGVVLWRTNQVNPLTAGLFIALFPAIFILAPLTQIGFPGVLINTPLELAFIALGCDLWTSTTTSVNA